MTSQEPVGIRHSIATRLLKIVFSIYILVAVGVTVGHMVAEYQYQKKTIRQDLENMQHTFQQPLAIDIWQMNQELLSSTIEGMLTTPVITGVEIRNTAGTLIAMGGVVSQDGIVGNTGQHVNLLGINAADTTAHHNEPYKFDIFMHRFPITYIHNDHSRHLGNAIIYSSTTVIFRRVKMGYMLLLVNAFLKTAALWVIFLFFSTRLLRRPLGILTKATAGITLNNLDSFKAETGMTGHNEITVLERTMREVVSELSRAVSERSRLETSLRGSEAKFRGLVESSGDWIWETGTDGTYTYSSPQVTAILGYAPQELIGKKPFSLMPPDTAERIETIVADAARNREPVFGLENINIHKDGHEVVLETTGVPYFDESGVYAGYRGIDRDITERKRDEDRIRTALKEKDVLLQEVHHRVKNNMQVISSLLSLQMNKMTNPEVKKVFTESRNRIRAMALVHEQLYKSNSLERINFAQYVGSISDELYRMYGINTQKVSMKTNCNGIELEIGQAVPCGLIVNELLSNAFKYAFPPEADGKGTIRLTLEKSPAAKSSYILTVSDDGVGLPASVELEQGESLGLQLVYMLGEGQLDGNIRVERKHGTSFIITFNSAEARK